MPKKQYKTTFSELFFRMICQFWIWISFQTSFAMHIWQIAMKVSGLFITSFYLSVKLFICKIFNVMTSIDFLLSNNKIVVLTSVNKDLECLIQHWLLDKQ